MFDTLIMEFVKQHPTIWVFMAALLYSGTTAWRNAKGKNSSYNKNPSQDQKHEEAKGLSHQTQQMVDSAFRLVEREVAEVKRILMEHDERFDKVDDTLRRMETIGEVLKDRQGRS